MRPRQGPGAAAVCSARTRASAPSRMLCGAGWSSRRFRRRESRAVQQPGSGAISGRRSGAGGAGRDVRLDLLALGGVEGTLRGARRRARSRRRSRAVLPSSLGTSFDEGAPQGAERVVGPGLRGSAGRDAEDLGGLGQAAAEERLDRRRAVVLGEGLSSAAATVQASTARSISSVEGCCAAQSRASPPISEGRDFWARKASIAALRVTVMSQARSPSLPPSDTSGCRHALTRTSWTTSSAR